MCRYGYQDSYWDDVDEPSLEPRWNLCPSILTYTESESNPKLIEAFAASHNVSTACLRSFNKRPLHGFLRGDLKLCAPLACEVEMVEEMQTVNTWTTKMSHQYSKQQFLRWNPCLSGGTHLFRMDTVCVGPHGGRYEPAIFDLED